MSKKNQSLDSIIDDVEDHSFSIQSVGYMQDHPNVSDKAMRASVETDLKTQNQDKKFPSFETLLFYCMILYQFVLNHIILYDFVSGHIILWHWRLASLAFTPGIEHTLFIYMFLLPFVSRSIFNPQLLHVFIRFLS